MDTKQSDRTISSLKFSIIIPAYKREKSLFKAIESSLNQKGDIQLEIVIVDDNPDLSVPSLEGKIRGRYTDSRIRYYQNTKNLGCFSNMNKCIQLAQYEFIVMLHDDDLLKPNHLVTVNNTLLAHPHIDMLFADQQVIFNGRTIKKSGYQKINRLLDHFFNIRYLPIRIKQQDFFIHNVVVGPTGVVFRKSVAENLGYFDNAFYPISDYKFWVDYCSIHNVYMLPQELSTYRHEENMTLSDGMFLKIFRISHLIQKFLLDKGTVQGPFAEAYLYESTRLRSISISNKTDLNLDTLEFYSGTFGEGYEFNLPRRILAKAFLLSKAFRWSLRVIATKIRSEIP